MSRSVVLTLAVLGTAVAVMPGAAQAARPRLSATPRNVHFGQQQLISGHQWPVIEFCRPTVRLSLVSAQNQVDLGTARVRANGTFSRRWTPRRSAVGAGNWHVRATQRCESGKDGSTIFTRRAIPIHIG